MIGGLDGYSIDGVDEGFRPMSATAVIRPEPAVYAVASSSGEVVAVKASSAACSGVSGPAPMPHAPAPFDMLDDLSCLQRSSTTAPGCSSGPSGSRWLGKDQSAAGRAAAIINATNTAGAEMDGEHVSNDVNEVQTTLAHLFDSHGFGAELKQFMVEADEGETKEVEEFKVERIVGDCHTAGEDVGDVT